MKRKKILFISNSAEIGGAEIILFELIKIINGDQRATTSLIFNKTIINTTPYAELARKILTQTHLIEDQFATASGSGKIAAAWNFLRHNFKLSRYINKDVIIFNNLPPLLYCGWIVSLLPRRPQLILFNHNSSTPKKQRWLLKLLSIKTDLTIHVSDAARNSFADFEPSQCARRIYNFSPIYNHAVTQNSDTPSIISISRITKQKGLHVLLLAYKIYIEKLPNQTTPWPLHIAGSPPENERHYLNDLRALAEELKIAEHISFLGHIDPGKFLSPSQIMVCPSIGPDSLPTSIIEAFSSKSLVIGSYIGGIPELVQHGRTGYLFPPGDTEALGRLLLEHAKLPANDADASIRDNALQFVQEQLSISAFSKSWIEAIYLGLNGAQKSANPCFD